MNRRDFLRRTVAAAGIVALGGIDPAVEAREAMIEICKRGVYPSDLHLSLGITSVKEFNRRLLLDGDVIMRDDEFYMLFPKHRPQITR